MRKASGCCHENRIGHPQPYSDIDSRAMEVWPDLQRQMPCGKQALQRAEVLRLRFSSREDGRADPVSSAVAGASAITAGLVVDFCYTADFAHVLLLASRWRRDPNEFLFVDWSS